MENFAKLTYCVGKPAAFSLYVTLDSYDIEGLKNQIEKHFTKRNEPNTQLRLYWIDDDNDEIDIFDQADYDIFLKVNKTKHLFLEPTGTPVDQATAQATFEHGGVFCSACAEQYMKGYYYFCHQCPDLYLCLEQAETHKQQAHYVERFNGRLPISQAGNVIMSEREILKELTKSISADISAALALALGDTLTHETEKAKAEAYNNLNKDFDSVKSSESIAPSTCDAASTLCASAQVLRKQGLRLILKTLQDFTAGFENSLQIAEDAGNDADDDADNDADDDVDADADNDDDELNFDSKSTCSDNMTSISRTPTVAISNADVGTNTEEEQLLGDKTAAAEAEAEALRAAQEKKKQSLKTFDEVCKNLDAYMLKKYGIKYPERKREPTLNDSD